MESRSTRCQPHEITFVPELQLRVHSPLYQPVAEVRILVDGELSLHLPLPAPRILNHLRTNRLKDLLLQRSVRLQSLLPAYMMTRKVSELLVISAHLVEQAISRSRCTRCDEPPIRSPEHVDNCIVQVFIVQDE